MIIVSYNHQQIDVVMVQLLNTTLFYSIGFCNLIMNNIFYNRKQLMFLSLSKMVNT